MIVGKIPFGSFRNLYLRLETHITLLLNFFVISDLSDVKSDIFFFILSI
ncbi:038R [Invertebrate iridescent virus Kaz2018]|uniref:Uncharacterized protein n=1 Tax=Iridovirus sp. TaxID=135728 RepID=A0AAU7YE19_9VIRU|nr:038R [Invertebrate iridescent virus Kaz2018]